MRLLRDESRVLSKSKSQIEQYLRSVKGHLQMLDNIRRVLQTKISTLSESLQLDAQSYKVTHTHTNTRYTYILSFILCIYTDV